MAIGYDDEDDDNDFRPVRRKSKAVGLPRILSVVTRIVSPVPFAFLVALFFLPWTDFGCQMKDGRKQLATQSGFEAAYGTASEGSALEEERKRLGRSAPTERPEDFFNATTRVGSKEPDRAFLLWPYLLVLIAGIPVPMLIGRMPIRGIVVTVMVGIAALFLVVQVAVLGMPLRNAVADFRKETGLNQNGGNQVVLAKIAEPDLILCTFRPSG